MVLSTGVSGNEGLGLFRFVCELSRFRFAWFRCPFVCIVSMHYSKSGSRPVTGFRFGWTGWPDERSIMSQRHYVVNWSYFHYKKYE